MEAPTGSEYYQNRGEDGKELKYTRPGLLLQKAYEYFRWCGENPWIRKEFIKSGKCAGEMVDIPLNRPYTIAGLCVYCGISKETFAGYGRREKFAPVVTHIRQVIEQNQLEGVFIKEYTMSTLERALGMAEKKDGESPAGITVNVHTQKAKKELEKLRQKLQRS